MKVFYPKYTRDQLVAELRGRLPALTAAFPVKQAVLFGSWATGRATAFSDVDLLVVYAGPPRPDAYEQVLRSLNIRGLEPHVYAESEAAAMRPTLDRMTAGGIPLMEAPEGL